MSLRTVLAAEKIKGSSRMYVDEGASSYVLNPRVPWMKNGGVIGNMRVGLYVFRVLLSKGVDTFSIASQTNQLDSQNVLE